MLPQQKRQIVCAIKEKRQIACIIVEKKTDNMCYQGHDKKTDSLFYRGKKQIAFAIVEKDR